MRIRLRYPALACVAAAITCAPAAMADDTNPTCTNLGGSTECSTPGNVQINSSPPTDTFTLPYWDEVFGGTYAGPYPVPYDEGSG
ncbi:MAG TPA: hypothetical protein VKI00_01110 [Mycobacterium sp.]|uniref:hypothetical protein n=1 Tax=Mycobacterium sp. TaxID=1785 RepID=UPI002CEC0CE9|nr:hypothetical protein [Mycobacterium sp.]HME74286.1 hypothetical protein [Mycobacterium sp.]